MEAIELYLFTKDLLLEKEVSEYINLEIERKTDTYSTLILRIEATKENILFLGTGKILATKSSPQYGYVIQHIEYSQGDNEFLEVVAFSLNYLLTLRTVYPQQYFYGTNENAIRYFVDRNIINPTNPTRRIPNFFLGAANNIGTPRDFSRTGGDLLEYCMSLANEVNAVVEVFINHTNRTLELEVVSGQDRSANQDVNPRVMFSEDFDNILQQNYFRSLINYKNAAIIAGEGEGVERTIVDNSTASGLDRRETFVDARDLQSTYKDDNDQDVTLTPSQYTNALISRGQEKLLEVKQTETFESTVDQTQYVYGIDYFLGDIVSIKSDKLNIIAHVPVSSVKITSNNTGITIVPSLGTGLPSIYARGGRR